MHACGVGFVSGLKRRALRPLWGEARDWRVTGCEVPDPSIYIYRRSRDPSRASGRRAAAACGDGHGNKRNKLHDGVTESSDECSDDVPMDRIKP